MRTSSRTASSFSDSTFRSAYFRTLLLVLIASNSSMPNLPRLFVCIFCCACQESLLQTAELGNFFPFISIPAPSPLTCERTGAIPGRFRNPDGKRRLHDVPRRQKNREPEGRGLSA